MVFGVDLDGTLDSYPRQLQTIMAALREAGHTVNVVTGSPNPAVDQAEWQAKADQLTELGLADCYDELVVVAGPENSIPQRKVLYLRSVGASVLVDNAEATARFASAAGLLVLVPWATRVGV